MVENISVQVTDKTFTEMLKDQCRAMAEAPADPMRSVKVLKANKDLYDAAKVIAKKYAEGQPKGYPMIEIEFNAFVPVGHIVGLDRHGKVVLLIGPKDADAAALAAKPAEKT